MTSTAQTTIGPELAARLLAVPLDRMKWLMRNGLCKTSGADPDTLTVDGRDLARLRGRCSRLLHHHAVQFFHDEDHLVRVVADYFAEGLDVGAPCIVIARPDRLERFASSLTGRGYEIPALIAQGRWLALDADATLQRFMVGDVPDRERFLSEIEPVLRVMAGAHPEARVRAYGEMVDLLMQRRNGQGALALEDLWNDLAMRQPFSLLCAYCMDNFQKDQRAEQYLHVCRAHTDTAPPLLV